MKPETIVYELDATHSTEIKEDYTMKPESITTELTAPKKTAKEIMHESKQRLLSNITGEVDEKVNVIRDTVRKLALTTTRNFGLGVSVNIQGLKVWVNYSELDLHWNDEFCVERSNIYNATVDIFMAAVYSMLKEEGFEPTPNSNIYAIHYYLG